MLLRGAPAGTHTPSLTARPGGSKIASTQRAPAGAQVTGVASLFGVHFTSPSRAADRRPGDPVIRPIRNYRDVVAGDAEMTRAVFIGLLNEGILLQTSCAGSLGVMTTEAVLRDMRKRGNLDRLPSAR